MVEFLAIESCSANFFGVRPARVGALGHVDKSSDPAFAHLCILPRVHLELDRLALCFELSPSSFQLEVAYRPCDPQQLVVVGYRSTYPARHSVHV